MKIIGRGDDSFIIEARRNEVANLIGYYWAGEKGCPMPKIGDEINISAMYEKLSDIKQMTGVRDTIKNAATSILNTVEIASPVIEALAKAAPQ